MPELYDGLQRFIHSLRPLRTTFATFSSGSRAEALDVVKSLDREAESWEVISTLMHYLSISRP